MYCRLRSPLFGVLLLVGCAREATTPDGAFLFDEDIALVRGERVDSAQREFAVDGNSVIVAIVDENLTDVSVRLSLEGPDNDAVKPVEVENHFGGAGIEVAALEVPRDSRVMVTLTGPPTATAPGRVHVHLRRFDATSKTHRFTAEREGFRAWSSATNAGFRVDDVKRFALADMNLAIASLERAQGDAPLSAHARLIKANLLLFFQIDFREARAEAQRAAQAFAALPGSTPMQLARARYVEAMALGEIGRIAKSVNPSAEEARTDARRLLTELSAGDSPLGSIERARAIDGLGYIDQKLALLDDAQKRFEEARALYQAAGYTVGEIEMSARFAHIFVERGQFHEGAKAFDIVLPDIQRISNPNRRISALTNAGRAESYSGRTDDAVVNLLEAIAQARDFKLRTPEGSASLELGFNYWHRGDYLQGKAYIAQALRIAREEQSEELAVTLQSAGMMERHDGAIDAAIELHQEGVRIATNPITRMRTMRHLALDYLAAGRHAEAIAELRNGLATKLQDPRHQAYSDLKRDLAELLIEYGDGSRATYAEAKALLAETLKMCLNVHDKLGEIGAHRVIARLHHKQGAFVAARTEYERAFELIFVYRRSSANTQLRMQTLAHEQPAFRGYFDLMMRNVTARGSGESRPATRSEEDALRVLELARESHFGLQSPGQLDAATTARIDALLARMADKSLEITEQLQREQKSQEAPSLASLQLEMSDLRAELDRERTAAAIRQAKDENSSADADQTWRTIAPRAVQLSYALGNDRTYVWVRSSAGIRVAALDEKPETIEQELAELASLDRQESPESVEQVLAHVSSVLLPPGLLPDDSNAVEVVAEGRIASVPFAGLRSPTDPSRRLVETHAVTMITSLLAVEEAPHPAQSRPFRLVALASGSGSLRSAAVVDPAPRLQAATTEIREVASLFEARDKSAKVKLLTGREGDAATLRRIWTSGADVMHFATHALADLRQPLASLLVLPAIDAGGNPAYLTAGQVQEWRGDADLVFLSACESAIGPPRFAGGMPGLQSAFLRAGARGVIATLWPIEDVLAREFSGDFYRRFTGGQSAARALSETQRAWLTPAPAAGEAERLRRRITALAHGFYTQ